ncbi:MAG: outer membrane beta-barrel protein [Gammaproteobacteria bacterium]|nr:outer membrane beta-barrel protein [Gammaproteobacteria bacterium]
MKLYRFLPLAALLPLGAVAQDLDYTFVELNYVDTELDAGPLDVGGDGLGVSGSLSVTDSVFLFANYGTQDYDFDVDSTGYDVGAGMRWGLKPRLDLIGEVAWAYTEVEVNGFSVDDDGLGLGLGLRGRAGEDFELQGGVRYVDYEDSETYVSLRGRWHFSSMWAAGLGLDFDDDASIWSLGLRAQFGN